MSEIEFKALMVLVMCSDPWPVDGDESGQGIIWGLLDREAEARGYDNWITAYHDMV